MPFRYPSYLRLKSNLGRIDAICGYATLGVDLLNEELEQADFARDWLSGTARMHGIVLHGVDRGLLPHRLAQMFIVTVHAQFDEFLHAFLKDHVPSREWPKKADGESLSPYVLKNLGLLFDSACAADREVTEYYRLIRNRFSHIEVNPKKVENQRKQLRNLINATHDWQPPKTYESVDYGDFDLFTRAVKSLSAKICEVARPSDKDLAETLKAGKYRALRRYAGDEKRYRNALKQALLMDFGLDEKESAPIIGLVVGG